MEKKKKATNKEPIQKAKNIKQNKKIQQVESLKIKSKSKNHRKISWKDIKQEKKLIIIPLLIFIVLIYCAYKVIILIQNPTDTFTVEQGKIYLEEASTRIYY